MNQALRSLFLHILCHLILTTPLRDGSSIIPILWGLEMLLHLVRGKVM